MIEASRRYPEEILSRGEISDEIAAFAKHMHVVWTEGRREILWNSDDREIGKVTDIFRSLVPYADAEERFNEIERFSSTALLNEHNPFYLRPILNFDDTCKLSAIISKISTAVDLEDQWIRIPRSSTMTTIALTYNPKKSIYLLLPKKSFRDISPGYVKQGRRAVLLSKTEALWNARIVWNLKAKSTDEALTKFNTARVVEKKLKEIISDEDKIFPKMLWDFSLEKRSLISYKSGKILYSTVAQRRSVFYEYWPMYLRYMYYKYIEEDDPEISKKNPAIKKILLNSAKVIEKLHAKKIGHGDIKLDNFLIDHSFECRLCDPDTVLFTNSNALSPNSFTLDYVSPMVLEAKFKKTSLEIDPLKEDIYALGCIFYLLFTCKQLPWEGLNRNLKGLQKSIKKRYELISQSDIAEEKLLSGSTEIIMQLIYWMLHPEAAKRPAIKTVTYWLELEAAKASMDSITII